MVQEDNVLWLRFLFLYAVAQAAADGPPMPSYDTGSHSWPQSITDPLELAKWALQQAAKNMQSQVSTPKDNVLVRKVLFAWEHPRDPEEYVSNASEEASTQPSWCPSGMSLGGFMGYTWLLSIRVPWVIGVLSQLV